MVLGVVAVIEPKPVVELVVAAHSPGDGLVGIAAVVEVIAIEIGEAVAEIIKRQEEDDECQFKKPSRTKKLRNATISKTPQNASEGLRRAISAWMALGSSRK
jgi:hypothetical protein